MLDKDIKISKEYFGAYLLIGQRIFTVNDTSWRILDSMSGRGKTAMEFSKELGLPYTKVLQCLDKLVDIGIVQCKT